MIADKRIDRFWPWIVCFAGGVVNFLASGGTRSMGILFVQLQQRFNANAGITGLVLGFTAAGFSIFSVLGNALGCFCGNRLLVLCGSLITFVSLLLTAFAPDVRLVVLTLGLSAGIGYGFIFGPSMVIVGQYFNKRRSAQANGLVVAGGSLGQVVIPFLLISFVNTFSFQGGTMLYAALALHAIPAALLLKPLKARQKVADTIEVTNDCHTEESKLTWQTQSNSYLHMSRESFSNPALHCNDAGFSQNNPVYEDVSFDKESWTVPSDMKIQSFFDLRDLGFGYSDTKPIMVPLPSKCQEFMRQCSDPAPEENEEHKRIVQTSATDDAFVHKSCGRKSDLGSLPDNTERDDSFKRHVEHKTNKHWSKQSLEEHDEGSQGTSDELGDFLFLSKDTEYDILDEISRECSIRDSVLKDSADNVTTEDNASEAGTLYSEFKDEFSTKPTDTDVVRVADNQTPRLEEFNAESRQSFSDIFKLLDAPVAKLYFDAEECSDFNFSVGSLNFDDTVDQMKKEKTTSEKEISHDFITNSNDEGTDDKISSTRQKQNHIDHEKKSLQRKKKSNKRRKTSEHRNKSRERTKKSSREHRTKTRQQKTRPAEEQQRIASVEKRFTSTETVDKNLLVKPQTSKILNHSSEKISSEQQERVSHSPEADDSTNAVPNDATQAYLNSDEWSGFLKSNVLFSSSNFIFDDSVQTPSATDPATLLHEEDVDLKPTETSAICKNPRLPSNFKQPSFYKCCKLFVNKVLLDQRLPTNWSYLFATGLAFSYSGCMNGCFFLPVFATEMGHSDHVMAALVSIMGAADLLGRIAGSLCSDQRTFKVTTLLGSILVICGLLAQLMTSFPRLWMLVLYGVFHGLLYGAYTTMLVLALVDVVGIENLASGIGFSTLLSGLFMLPTSSILGLVQEATGSFALSLRICGLFLIVGGLIINIHPFIQKLQSQQTSNSPQSNATEARQNIRAAAVGSFNCKLDNPIMCNETVV